MSLEVIVYILTALAAVVVVLTRLRLRNEEGAGRHKVGTGLLNLHTLFGTWRCSPGSRSWCCAEDASWSGLLGIVALGCWWVTVLAGLMLLVRWIPSRGRHASDAIEDTWSEGPGLSVLAHVGPARRRPGLHLRLPDLGRVSPRLACLTAIARCLGLLLAGARRRPHPPRSPRHPSSRGG